ncbi:hypothetical protein ACHQM5_009181 [Ranunculus cassubicifolius]
MELPRIQTLVFLSFLAFYQVVHGWGEDGHLITCRLAQTRLSEAANAAIKDLLPAYANDDLGSLCSWADQVRIHYPWSTVLHYLNTPDNLCNYQYNSKQCSELLTYSNPSSQSLLFLSHLIGDIHQPLHTGFASDKGGNTINVNWYTRKENLHHVWDENMIETAEERFYDTNVDDLIHAIQTNVTSAWANKVKRWETCSCNDTACPDIYASESIHYACARAYKGVSEGSTLVDDYFLSRLPIVNLRLAQGGVRLAAILNRIFGRYYKLTDNTFLL